MSNYPIFEPTDPSGLTRKSFVSNQEVRWCPGCGDYAVLASVQKVLPELGIPQEDFVFISGIGCSSRFPYYMETFGMHSIHGRAPAIASGTKAFRPNLNVWVMTGDGDGLSIGGNHLIHAIRRNIGLKIILFNNRIYGLTKGQYSPTSEMGKKSKSSPMGTVDYPFNPISVALGTGGTFVARTMDANPKHMQEVLKAAALHEGTAFVEVLQNCVIFNDGAFTDVTSRQSRGENTLDLVDGKPLLFGNKNEKGIILDKKMRPQVVKVDEVGLENILVHDADNEAMAFMLSHMTIPNHPVPMGVFRSVARPSYEQLLEDQINTAKAKKPNASVQSLLESGYTWRVE
ncbi:2-oxoacid:ferredoxin oxidoreductase subunit beta [Myxococcota bacterium]|nr:2-oxoacid:ferredoxin oxidoreductase subunit beta [Myxococcota bacterium]MBU1432400.1 2-oxoacid:ferredoxin oxidoreductase subunit beta [Myxococcota bacterium]MBU1899463.1 2-oxoacid:ferredoxin oxidoreductase subunit beta [Myxococcota bacterium]